MHAVLPSSPLRSLTLLLSALASTAMLFSQTPGPQVSTYDGGARQTLESIFIPPIAQAPFSLMLETEWSRPLGNGGNYTLVNRRRIMRDSTGRIYQERWMLVPMGGKMESTMDFIQIADPAEHTLYNCQIDIKKCFMLTYKGSASITYRPATAASGPLPEGNGYHLHESLGHNDVGGIDAIGSRETTTLNPGVFGNDQPMVTTREFWYSPHLGINMLSKLDGPQIGKQLFTVKELTTSEPDARYFALPEGFVVIDQRQDQH